MQELVVGSKEPEELSVIYWNYAFILARFALMFAAVKLLSKEWPWSSDKEETNEISKVDGKEVSNEKTDGQMRNEFL